VNQWLLGAVALLVLLLPAGLLTLRGSVLDRVVAMQLTSTIGTLAIVLLAQGFGRDVYFDLGVVTAVLSFAGTLFYLRAIEAWL
jgi:multicomponent Na+:H+ antiporter subunit F